MWVSPNLGKTNEYLQNNLSYPIWALQICGHAIWLDQCPNYDMCLMNTFKKYLGKFILVFMDDILVYSKSSTEHEKHL
jgi:hypothetical protein